MQTSECLAASRGREEGLHAQLRDAQAKCQALQVGVTPRWCTQKAVWVLAGRQLAAQGPLSLHCVPGELFYPGLR